MRILVVGSSENWSIERYYCAYLNDFNGVDVELFPIQNIFTAYYNRSVLNKVLYRLGISGILRRVNELLIKKIEDYKPDIIWVFKGMEILPSTLKLIKSGSKNLVLVNYNPDNPFVFTGRGSGNSNVSKSIGLYNCHLSYNLEVIDLLKSVTQARVEFLPFGYDISPEVYNEVIRANETEIVKACFVGNPDKTRRDFLLNLAERNVIIDVYGDNWRNFLSHKNITVFPAARDRDFWIVMRRYRVQLNLMRIHNLNSHNMRTFEIPAIGGIQLAPDTKEHRIFFEAEKDIFLFSDVDICVNQINKLLSYSKEQAAYIRSESAKAVIEKEYSYKGRSRIVYELFLELANS